VGAFRAAVVDGDAARIPEFRSKPLDASPTAAATRFTGSLIVHTQMRLQRR
jgi:hypothetical protein